MNEPRVAGVTVTSTELPADIGDRARAIKGDMVVIPKRWAEDGRGVYGEATVFLVKELRAEGVNAFFLDRSQDRLFEVKKSALLTGLAAIGLAISGGVGTNAAWEGLKRILDRHSEEESDTQIELTYVDLSDERSTQYTVRGPVSGAIEAIDHLRGESAGQNSRQGEGFSPNVEEDEA